MSEENVRALRDAMDAYKRGDKRAWTSLMDPELETVPLPEWPESGPFIGPDAAWDFYKHFDEEMLPAREAYEITELIDAGDSLFACHEAPMRGRASAAEVGLKLLVQRAERGPRSRRAVGVVLWTKSGYDFV